jgi:hypothetical protein
MLSNEMAVFLSAFGGLAHATHTHANTKYNAALKPRGF